jgi:hypothetical protein
MTKSRLLFNESSFKLYFLRVKGFNIKVKNMNCGRQKPEKVDVILMQ